MAGGDSIGNGQWLSTSVLTTPCTTLTHAAAWCSGGVCRAGSETSQEVGIPSDPLVLIAIHNTIVL